jgi:ribosome-associated translation inhibitor RaiA
MQTDITFRDMSRSPALEATIHEWVGKLEHISPVNRCSVVIEMPHKHQRQGRTFRVRLDVAVAGRSISVSRPDNGNAYLAITDAFRTARRQLVDFLATRRDARPAV